MIYNNMLFFITAKDENKKSKTSLELLPKSIVLLRQDIMGTTMIKMDPTWASLVQGESQLPPKHQPLKGRVLRSQSHSR